MVDLKELAGRSLNKVSDVMFGFEGAYVEGKGYEILRQGPRPSFEACGALNVAAGIAEDDWKNQRYPASGLEPLRLILASDGRFFIEFGSEKVLLPYGELYQEIVRQCIEDRETLKARGELALQLAGEFVKRRTWVGECCSKECVELGLKCDYDWRKDSPSFKLALTQPLSQPSRV